INFNNVLFVPNMSLVMKVGSSSSLPATDYAVDIYWQFTLQRVWVNIILGERGVKEDSTMSAMIEATMMLEDYRQIKLKDMAERLPPGSYDFESIIYASELDQNGHDTTVNGDDKSVLKGSLSPTEMLKRTLKAEEPMWHNSRSPKSRISYGKEKNPNGNVGTNSYNPMLL
nr:folylpolyglutamate synthase isoform X8 [Tanacetum cinerariifolium]